MSHQGQALGSSTLNSALNHVFSVDASQSHRFNDSVQQSNSIVKSIESANSSRQDNNDPASFSVKINSKKVKKVGSVVSSADSNNQSVQNAELNIQMDYALKRKLVDKRREL